MNKRRIRGWVYIFGLFVLVLFTVFVSTHSSIDNA